MDEKLRTITMLGCLICMGTLLYLMYKAHKRNEQMDKALMKQINRDSFIERLTEHNEKLPENPN